MTRVLLVVHGLPPAGSGGTETYVDDLAQALARQRDVAVSVLSREGDALSPELAIRSEQRGRVAVRFVNNTFQTCEGFEDTYVHERLRRTVAPILDDARPDVVHVQHLTCLSTGIVEDAALRGIPVIVTLNDYWWMCHRGQLFTQNGARCDGPGERGCASCIPAAALAPASAWRAGRRLRTVPGTAVVAAERLLSAAGTTGSREAASRERSAHMRRLSERVTLFLAPSRTLKRQYEAFGIPAERLRLIDQGIDTSTLGSVTRRARTGPLRAGFVGSLIPSKAPHVLLDAAEMLPAGTISVDFIGALAPYHGDTSYMDALVARLGSPAVRRLGPVPHASMAERLGELDVLVVPSVWIENAPFVIREAFAAGVPVVASDLGGMAELVRDGVDGILFPAGDPAALARVLRSLADDPGRIERLRAGIRRVMTIDEDAAQLAEIYRAVRRPAATSVHSSPSSSRDRTEKTAAVVLNYRTPDQTWLAVKSLQASLLPPDEVFVVDNGSCDGSEESLRAALPGAHILQSGANLGFSGGCNAGIQKALDAGAARVLLLNSDAVLAPDALGSLCSALDDDPSIGIAGPVVLSRAEPDAIATAGIMFATHTGRMRHRAAGRRLASLGSERTCRVDAVSGCAMLVRREVFEQAGLLDEPCFYSFEDVDFCLRAAKDGYATVCVTGALAYHEGGRSIGARSARRVYYGVRNHLRVARRVAPKGRAASSARAAAITALTAAYVIVSPEVPLGSGLIALVRGVRDHVRGRYGA